MKNKQYWLIPMCSLLLVAVTQAASLKTQKQKFSYAVGIQVGQDFKRKGLDLDINAVVQAIRDVQAGKKPTLSQEQMQKAVDNYQREAIKTRQVFASKQLSLSNVYLNNNKKKKNVVVSKSGLQYQILKKGAGSKPKITDKVEVHYHGTLIDGRIFDSSVNRGQSTTFAVNRVIQGWQEVLPMMKKGAKWRVTIPPDLAYGVNGPPNIGPNAVLIFEIELIDIK